MLHLYEKNRLNSLITTITAQAPLTPCRQVDRDRVEIEKDLVFAAVNNVVDRRADVKKGEKEFKNCVIISLPVESSRGATRMVSVKVFRNLTLHIAGCHSMDMIEFVKHTMLKELSTSLMMPLQAADVITTTMVNYGYSLPGRVNLYKLCSMLTREEELLVIFDPSKYAGANVKFPFVQTRWEGLNTGKARKVEHTLYGSIMVFESSKIIISTPRCDDRDTFLTKIITFIEQAMVHRWSDLKLS